MKRALILLTALLAGKGVLAQTITVDPITTANVCSGSTLTVGYQTTGSFNPGNHFVLQRSDPSGSFASFQNLATDSTNGRFVVTLSETGDHFRFRVISTSPYLSSADNGQDIRVMSYPYPTATVHRPSGREQYLALTGNPVIFSVSASAGDSVLWSFPAGASPATSTEREPAISFATPGLKTGYVTETNAAGCAGDTSASVLIAECHPVIPKGTRIVTGVETGSQKDVSVLVKTGATFTAGSHGTVYVEPGGYVKMGPGQYHSIFYLENGASVQLDNMGQAADFVLGSNVAWPSSTDLFDTVRCNDLSFDYSELKADVATSPLKSTARFLPSNSEIAWTGSGSIEVEALSILGATVLRRTIDANHPLPITSLPKGAYILRSITGAAPAIRFVH